jgi:hypothetical protein
MDIDHPVAEESRKPLGRSGFLNRTRLTSAERVLCSLLRNESMREVGAVSIREIYIEVKGQHSEKQAEELLRALWPAGDIPGELRMDIKSRENGRVRCYDYQFIPGPIQAPICLRRDVQREHAKTAIRHLWPTGDLPRVKERKRLIDEYCSSQGWESISSETIGRARRELGIRKQAG